jgi:uncharacterized protein YbjT (DUF2867 family)
MILVTGATGNIGRPLIDLLYSQGARIRGVTRSPRTAALPAHVEVIEGNPSRPDTISSALRGVTGLFFNPLAVQSAIGELLALAREQGVKRVVALSATNVDDDPADQPSRMRGVNHKAVEEALSQCGLEWVALRISVYATNSIALWAAQVRANDVVYGPYAASASSPIHELDVAAVAARALLTDELVGTRPLLTGPQSLTQEQMVGILGDAIGRPLRYQEIPPEAAKRAMIERGFPFPEELIDRLHALLAKAVGQPALTTNDVETILGRPALTYAQWATSHTDAFRAASS